MLVQDTTVPVGFCQCGCGERTMLAKKTYAAKQMVKGAPLRYIPAHTNRAPRSPKTLEKRRQKAPIGTYFGAWLVIGPPVVTTSENGRARSAIPCRCLCGKEQAIDLFNLLRGVTQSCGCQRKTTLTHGETDTPLHIVWSGILNRCRNAGSSVFRHYGGRGITFASEWESYEAFRDWALGNGYAPGLEIDRIDNDGNYEPTNCRWVTHSTNMRNTRATHMVTAFGETKSMKDWSEDGRCSIKYGTLASRLGGGWMPERAISEPAR